MLSSSACFVFREGCNIKIEIDECKIEEPWKDSDALKEIINKTITGVVHCSLCPDKVFDNEDLHQKYVDLYETRAFFCPIHSPCTEIFTKHGLVIHCYEHGVKVKNWSAFFHKALQENPNVIGRSEEACEICSQLFKNRNDLTLHYETHGHRFTCEVCTVGFKKVMDYVCHAQTHHEKRLFTCPLCGITKEKRGPMKKHIDRHDQFKRYKCSQCESRFAYYAKYYEHIQYYHSGIKGFECDICGSRLKSSGSLRYHKLNHKWEATGEKHCELCNFKFNSYISRKNHYSKYHP